jgi:mRNA-degrading endonuclease RelE of RelBE toxin-antitoxin system
MVPAPFFLKNTKQVTRYLDRSPQAKRLADAILRLRSDLLPGDAIPLKGSPHHYRMRVGNWRIKYYFVPETNTVVVYEITRREDAY